MNVRKLLDSFEKGRRASYYRMRQQYGAGWELAMLRMAETEIKIYARDAAAAGTPYYWLDALIQRIAEDINAVLEEHKGHRWDFIEEPLRNLGSRAYADFLRLFVSDRQLPDRNALMQNARGYKGTIEREQYGRTPSVPISTETPGNVHTAATYSMVTPTGRYFKEYMAEVKAQLDKIVLLSAKPTYSDRVNLLNIAEMTVRYEDNLNQIEEKKKRGARLVYVEPHANCSERCSHWQVGGDRHRSGLYSLDGTKGYSEDGQPFVPIETAMDQFVTTRSGRTYRNGLFGFNCRHRLVDWEKGNKPIPIPAEVIEKRRKAEEKQRQMEREYRQLREAATLYRGFPGLEGAAKWAREKAAALRKEYEAFTGKHDLVMYDDRLKSFAGEHSPEMQKRIRERTLTQYYKWLERKKARERLAT